MLAVDSACSSLTRSRRCLVLVTVALTARGVSADAFDVTVEIGVQSTVCDGAWRALNPGGHRSGERGGRAHAGASKHEASDEATRAFDGHSGGGGGDSDVNVVLQTDVLVLRAADAYAVRPADGSVTVKYQWGFHDVPHEWPASGRLPLSSRTGRANLAVWVEGGVGCGGTCRFVESSKTLYPIVIASEPARV
jgi:hypothetical protein